MQFIKFGVIIINKSNVFLKILIHIPMILLSLLCIIPIAIIISASLSDEMSIIRNGYSVLPRGFSMEAYNLIMRSSFEIINAYSVTIAVTVVGTLLSMLLVTMTAYTLSRTVFRYKNIISFFIYFTMLFSGGMVPSYLLVTRYLKMGNTFWVLFIPMLIAPWYIFLMRSFLRDIPSSLIESAKLDGAHELSIFFRIVIPISKPALATISLMLVMSYWNSWMASLLYVESNNLFTLQYLLYMIMSNLEELRKADAASFAGGMAMPQLTVRMAMCVLAAGPMLVVFPFFQKYFVKGITAGAVKG